MGRYSWPDLVFEIVLSSSCQVTLSLVTPLPLRLIFFQQQFGNGTFVFVGDTATQFNFLGRANIISLLIIVILYMKDTRSWKKGRARIARRKVFKAS